MLRNPALQVTLHPFFSSTCFSLTPSFFLLFSFHLPTISGSHHFKRGWGLPYCIGVEITCLSLLFYLHGTPLQIWLVILFGLTALTAWYFSMRDAWLIQNTPTSRIASAAQGYVELQGRGLPLDDTPLRCPLHGLPVLWYRYQIEERDSDNKWQICHEEESQFSFQLDDGSGQCVVDPTGAYIVVDSKETETVGDTRRTQWSLVKQARIYVLGYFSSATPEPLAARENEAVKTLLADWKNTPTQLLQRFDLNKDGALDLREWALARAAAQRQVRATLHEQGATPTPPRHLVKKSPSGNGQHLFLISDLDPARLLRRYRWQGALHMVGFLAACGLAAHSLAAI